MPMIEHNSTNSRITLNNKSYYYYYYKKQIKILTLQSPDIYNQHKDKYFVNDYLQQFEDAHFARFKFSSLSTSWRFTVSSKEGHFQHYTETKNTWHPLYPHHRQMQGRSRQ